jgi:hypothetical protein
MSSSEDSLMFELFKHYLEKDVETVAEPVI